MVALENNNFNLQIENFKSNLKNLIGNCGLPIGVVSLVLYQINNEISNLYFEQIQKELQNIREDEDNGSTINNSDNNT